MAPTLVQAPFHRDGWIYQEKVDGWRMLAYKEGSRVRLISRRAIDHTIRFRELVTVSRIHLLMEKILVGSEQLVQRVEELVLQLVRQGARTPSIQLDLCRPGDILLEDAIQPLRQRLVPDR
jgi:bifunctional non-homologous end joining protein LigD